MVLLKRLKPINTIFQELAYIYIFKKVPTIKIMTLNQLSEAKLFVFMSVP